MNEAATIEDRLILRGELPKLLRVHTDTVRKWLKAGMLPEPDLRLSHQRYGWRDSTLKAAGINLPPPTPTPKAIEPPAPPKVMRPAPPPRLEEVAPLPVAFGESGCHLYRHFDQAGRLLYVGISLSALKRLESHKKHAAWFRQIAKVEIETYLTRSDALLAERLAIQREEPLHNIIHSTPVRLRVFDTSIG